MLKSASYFVQFAVSIKRFVVENETRMDRGLERRSPQQEQRVPKPLQMGDTKTLECPGHQLHLRDPGLQPGDVADVGADQAH